MEGKQFKKNSVVLYLMERKGLRSCTCLRGQKEKKNYRGSGTLPTSTKERVPHWCTDRMTHPPRSSD
eukprot:952165-Pelagomonas_calceolata.AAC.1